MQPPLDKVYGLALDVDDDPLRQYRPAAERQARYPEKPGIDIRYPSPLGIPPGLVSQPARCRSWHRAGGA